MSQQSVREIVKRLHPRYLQASRVEKSKILDEFVALTGYHRKYAIQLLRKGNRHSSHERRGRQRIYTGAVISVLAQIWRICGCICGKRLQPFLPEMVKTLERHGELSLDEETRTLLLQMSAATIDRRLRPFRATGGRGVGTTKPGTLLKQSIPIRTFADWDDVQPGFVEIDLVAHCGQANQGVYLNTLTVVDIATGWTECLALAQRSQRAVSEALETLQARLPFPLLGLDCDNDSVFINETLLRYCTQNQITFTRSRPYRKNDQAHVEERNGSVVRRTIGYRRYESPEALALFEAIYADLHLYANFFQPTLKLLVKKRRGSKVYKKHDKALTAHQRVMRSSDVDKKVKLKLHQTYLSLNPAALRRRIDANLKALARLPG